MNSSRLKVLGNAFVVFAFLTPVVGFISAVYIYIVVSTANPNAVRIVGDLLWLMAALTNLCGIGGVILFVLGCFYKSRRAMTLGVFGMVLCEVLRLISPLLLWFGTFGVH